MLSSYHKTDDYRQLLITVCILNVSSKFYAANVPELKPCEYRNSFKTFLYFLIPIFCWKGQDVFFMYKVTRRNYSKTICV
jgi:hypothetical protein